MELETKFYLKTVLNLVRTVDTLKISYKFIIMEEVEELEFDENHPEELDGKVVSEEVFEEIKEKMDLGENIRFGKRGWDAPIGEVKIWVQEDDPEEDE